MYKHKKDRQVWKSCSNNPDNPNKNICALAVAQAFWVEGETRYLHTTDDILRALRKCWSVLKVRYSRRETLGKFKSDLKKLRANDDRVVGYMVYVAGHVLAMSADGKMVVDTAPNDDNIVLKVWAIRDPEPTSKAAYSNFLKLYKRSISLTTQTNQSK